MKYCFNAHVDTYIQEHDDFINQIVNLEDVEALEEIIYKGQLPRGYRTVTFSRYLDLNGYAPLDNGFCGFYGKKSYDELLKEFLKETLSENRGTAYKIEIDVERTFNNEEGDNLSFYVENLMTGK